MKQKLFTSLSLLVALNLSAVAQRPGPPPNEGERPPRGEGPRRGGGGPRPENLGESNAELGSAGIVWYPILADGLAEARRTNRPILFMAVASQCGGVPGVF